MYKFKKDAVVCFLGDSITNRGRWIAKTRDYYRDNIPGSTIKMFNCGRSGGDATVAVERMEVDVIPHNPTDVVIMFGMNDIRHPLYHCEKVTEEIILERNRALESYLTSLKKIADRLSGLGANLIFCTPTPTDVDQISELDYLPATKLALQRFSKEVKKLAENYGGHIVDFQTEFSEMIEILRQEDIHNNIVDGDRVHPSVIGEEVMSKLFLRAQGFDVTLHTKMADWQKEYEKPLSNYSQAIFDTELLLRAIAFVEWGLLENAPEEEREAKLNEIYNAEDATDFVRSRIDLYRENKPHQIELEEKLERIS